MIEADFIFTRFILKFQIIHIYWAKKSIGYNKIILS